MVSIGSFGYAGDRAHEGKRSEFGLVVGRLIDLLEADLVLEEPRRVILLLMPSRFDAALVTLMGWRSDSFC
jgi:hypothetical protein